MTMKAIVCFVVVLILTGLVLLQLRSIRLGLASREWNVARGRIVRAFVDDDGSDGEDGELLHSTNVRYVYNVDAGKRWMCHDPRKPDRSVLIQGIARGDITRCAMSFLLAVAVAVCSW